MIETPSQPSYSTTTSRTKGLVFDIKRYALHDGPGIRTTVFLKGCALRCWWCHNPESQLPHPEVQQREIRLDNTCLTEHVTLGQEMAASDVLKEVERDRVFYDESGGGVTFSGGEPLIQSDFLMELLLDCGRLGLHRVLDTCGYAPHPTVVAVAPHVDLFLFDLKLMDDQEHREYTGVSNELILANLAYLLETDAQIVIRFPLIPGITDTDKNLESLRSFLDRRPSLTRMDILPYHQIARSKYERLGRPNRARAVVPPTEAALRQVRTYFETDRRVVRIGG